MSRFVNLLRFLPLLFWSWKVDGVLPRDVLVDLYVIFFVPILFYKCSQFIDYSGCWFSQFKEDVSCALFYFDPSPSLFPLLDGFESDSFSKWNFANPRSLSVSVTDGHQKHDSSFSVHVFHPFFQDCNSPHVVKWLKPLELGFAPLLRDLCKQDFERVHKGNLINSFLKCSFLDESDLFRFFDEPTRFPLPPFTCVLRGGDGHRLVDWLIHFYHRVVSERSLDSPNRFFVEVPLWYCRKVFRSDSLSSLTKSSFFFRYHWTFGLKGYTLSTFCNFLPDEADSYFLCLTSQVFVWPD